MFTARSYFMDQESPANSLDTCSDNVRLVIAGRNIFKIFTTSEHAFSEVINLRAGKHINLNYSCIDVAWNQVEDNLLATAATNGSVVLWNLGKASKSKQTHVFQEHKRTVNKVHFNPLDSNLLISGSQDSIIKLFDIRVARCTATFSSSTESVRDVQFNPHCQYRFVSVTENGRVSIWDYRRPDRAEKSWTAHAENVLACDWHPEIRHWLATAGRDKQIKIWKTAEYRPEVDTVIHTLAPIAKIQWRPNRRAHIASASLTFDFTINIWDIRRPCVPFAIFSEHRDVTTGIAWRKSMDSLFSTSRDGTLFHHAFSDAIRPSERANPVGLDINPFGDVALAVRDNNVKGIQTDGSSIDSEAAQQSGNIPQAPPLPPYGINVPGTSASSAVGQQQQQQQPPTVTPSMVQHQVRGSSNSLSEMASSTSSSGSTRHSTLERNKRLSSDSLMNPESGWKTVTYKHRQKRKFSVGEERFRAARSLLTAFSVLRQSKASSKFEPSKAFTSSDWFVYAAKNYAFKGKSFPYLCDHNAKVASNMNREQLAMSWIILKTLYGYYNFDQSIKAVSRQHHESGAGMSGNQDQSQQTDNENRHRHRSEIGPAGRSRRFSGAVTGEHSEELANDRNRHPSQIASGGASSSDETENEDSMNLSNIPGTEDLVGDFFGDNELTTIGIEQFVHADQGQSLMNNSFDWNLKAEGFEFRHEFRDFTTHEEATAAGTENDLQQESKGQVANSSMSVTIEEQASSLLRVKDVQIYAPWSPDQNVKELLIHYADVGDVQSTVAMYMVLGHERLKNLFPRVTVEFWFQSYIELLHQFQLVNEAAKIIRICPHDSIRGMSMDSTTYLSNCSKCQKALNRSQGGWFCERCKALPNLCSICRQASKGLLAWCKGCSHGGHIEHMRLWFKYRKNKFCPTGCGHQCAF